MFVIWNDILTKIQSKFFIIWFVDKFSSHIHLHFVSRPSGIRIVIQETLSRFVNSRIQSLSFTIVRRSQLQFEKNWSSTFSFLFILRARTVTATQNAETSLCWIDNWVTQVVEIVLTEDRSLSSVVNRRWCLPPDAVCESLGSSITEKYRCTVDPSPWDHIGYITWPWCRFTEVNTGRWSSHDFVLRHNWYRTPRNLEDGTISLLSAYRLVLAHWNNKRRASLRMFLHSRSMYKMQIESRTVSAQTMRVPFRLSIFLPIFICQRSNINVVHAQNNGGNGGAPASTSPYPYLDLPGVTVPTKYVPPAKPVALIKANYTINSIDYTLTEIQMREKIAYALRKWVDYSAGVEYSIPIPETYFEKVGDAWLWAKENCSNTNATPYVYPPPLDFNNTIKFDANGDPIKPDYIPTRYALDDDTTVFDYCLEMVWRDNDPS